MRAALKTLLFDIALLFLDPILFLLIACGIVAVFKIAAAVKACLGLAVRK